MNMATGIRLKIDRLKIGGLKQKCITEDFPQLLEVPLLRTHIRGCFQTVREAAFSRIFAKYLGNQM